MMKQYVVADIRQMGRRCPRLEVELDELSEEALRELHQLLQQVMQEKTAAVRKARMGLL